MRNILYIEDSAEDEALMTRLHGVVQKDFNGKAALTVAPTLEMADAVIAGQRIDVIHFNDDNTDVEDVTEMTLPMDPGRFRSVVMGPDGSLYTSIDEGTIYKLTPGS
jgi:hypothetical protein